LAEPEDKAKKKKSRLKKLLCWLAIDLLVAAIFVLLLLYRPGRYHPVVVSPTDPNGQRVHPYVSQELGPQFNNGVEARRSFRMTIRDKAFNEAIALFKWPQEAQGVSLSLPQVLFQPGRIVLMGTATIEGADLVVTAELQPLLDERGLLNLDVKEVKVGAMPITTLAKMIGKQKYEERVAMGGTDPEDIRTQIAASLLTGQAFDPVVEYDGKKVRLKSIEISPGQLDVEFAPVK
jgi:hypothetical protein